MPKEQYPRPSPETRFWPFVNQNGPVPMNRPELGPCWIWTGNTMKDGYTHFKVSGKTVKAHRFSYELLIGAIPDNLALDHLCRIRNCVNPSHLEPVTQQVNILRGDGRAAL